MKKKLLMFAIGASVSVSAQEVEAADRLPNFNAEDIFRNHSQDSKGYCHIRFRNK